MRPTKWFQILEYEDSQGKSPYREWLYGLDVATRARIQARILRLESGNLGDHRNVGEGVWEARLDFGPGYRVYFAFDGECLILLLCGGDKGSQKRDIKKAHQYWFEYNEV